MFPPQIEILVELFMNPDVASYSRYTCTEYVECVCVCV